MRSTKILDLSEAQRMITAIQETLKERKKSAVIAVADSHGELIAFVRMDGAPLSSIRIAINKAWSAARERKPTKDIGEKARDPIKGFDIAYFGDPQFVGWGGGIPIWRDGDVVGSIAVSGLPSAEDIEMAELGAGVIGGTGV